METILKSNSLIYLHKFSLYLQQLPFFLLETDLKTVWKVVNHSDAFLFDGDSDVLRDCLFKFEDCLRVVVIYTVPQITPYKEVWWIQVEWMRGPLWISASIDQSLGKALIEPVKGHIGCIGSSSHSSDSPGQSSSALGSHCTSPLLQWAVSHSYLQTRMVKWCHVLT